MSLKHLNTGTVHRTQLSGWGSGNPLDLTCCPCKWKNQSLTSYYIYRITTPFTGWGEGKRGTPKVVLSDRLPLQKLRGGMKSWDFKMKAVIKHFRQYNCKKTHKNLSLYLLRQRQVSWIFNIPKQNAGIDFIFTY